MKIKSIFFAAAALLFAASCTEIEQNNPELQQPEAKYVIYANAPATKTALEADGAVTWVKGDVIAVAQRGVETATAELAHFTNMSENGATAAFEGVRLPSHNDIVAVYPASAFVKETTAGSVVNIPAVQYAEAGKFPVNAATNGSVINPSYAYCASENEQGQIVMNFKNLGGLIKIEIPEHLDNIKKIEIKADDATETALAGDFTLAVNENGEIVSFKASDNTIKTVTLLPANNAASFAVGDYYVVAAPAALKGFTITYTTVLDYTFVKHQRNQIDFKRSSILPIPTSTLIPAPKVGDYFYSDGTWSTNLKEGKSIIGYVFSTTDRTADDAELKTRLKSRAHGYVISDQQIPSTTWGAYWGFGTGDVYPDEWQVAYGASVQNPTWKTYPLHDEFHGFRATIYNRSYKYTMFMKIPTNAPKNTSNWYIPSTGEFDTLFKVLPTIVSLKFQSQKYWTSSVSRYEGLHKSVAVYLDGENSYYSYGEKRNVSYPALYMLAF